MRWKTSNDTLCIRLTRELEKKFSDRHVVFIAQRRMLRKPTRTSRVKQKRPRSRTLTNVHEKILEDLVFPTEIVGKRTRVAVDGSRLLKVCVCLLRLGLSVGSDMLIYLKLQFPRLQGCYITRVQARLLLVCLPPADREGRRLRIPCPSAGVSASLYLLLLGMVMLCCFITSAPTKTVDACTCLRHCAQGSA